MTSEANFSHRKHHYKSRKGCLECKKRKVKCDEMPNSCGACLKRRTRCSFKQPTPPPSPRAELSVPVPVTNILDLELIHNFSSKTSTSMGGNAPLQRFYATDFVTEALKHDYVLHCLLGLSAFHLVQQYQELLQSAPEHQKMAIRAKIKDYLFAAHVYHSEGLSIFRKTLTTITKENCNPLFAAATLIVVTSFAESCEGVRSTVDANLHPSDQEPTVTKWMILLRGVKTVVTQTWMWVKSGPMAPMVLQKGLDGWDSTIGAVDSEVTLYLDRMTTAFYEYSEPDIINICLPAIELLRKSWLGIASGCDSAVAFFWAVLVEDEFMVLLESRKPEALVILGAYCVLMYTLHPQWWMKGWSEYMLKMIEGLIDESWKGWLEWPAQVIGNKEEKFSGPVLVITEGVCCQ